MNNDNVAVHQIMNNNHVTHISWDQFRQDAQMLSHDFIAKNESEVDKIVCITRGGLFVAGVVGFELNVHQIETFAISSYETRTQGNIKVWSFPTRAISVGGLGWIVVDELSDTGATINFVKSYLPKAKYYAVYSKLEDAEDIIDGYVKSYKKGTWLQFPWEN